MKPFENTRTLKTQSPKSWWGDGNLQSPLPCVCFLLSSSQAKEQVRSAGNWTSTCRRMKLDHSLRPYTKINSKWMKDLNVRQDSIKILEENTGNTLFELGHSNFLQDTSMKARETKAKMNYWDLIKIFLRFCSYFLILVFSVLNQSIVEFANSFFC